MVVYDTTVSFYLAVVHPSLTSDQLYPFSADSVASWSPQDVLPVFGSDHEEATQNFSCCICSGQHVDLPEYLYAAVFVFRDAPGPASSP